MADAEWKKRVGITINYSSGEEEENLSVQYRVKAPSKATISVDIDPSGRDIDDDIHPSDDLDVQFEEYGNTPPRTRIKIKNRDWERKQKLESSPPKKGMTRLARSRVQRRNTMDCAILNQMFVEEEGVKRTDKRAQALLRESERNFKHFTNESSPATVTTSTVTASAAGANNNCGSSRLSSILRNNHDLNNAENVILRNSGVPTLIESCNRYMSVSSRPVGCRVSAPVSAFSHTKFYSCSATDSPRLNSRKEFHETFANLIKLGSIDRQDSKISHEDHTWQTELKDLIWLELQAWHADRTLEQQDKYLFTARQAVPDLLNQILNYRFRPKLGMQSSTISADSGFISESSSSNEIYKSSGLNSENLSSGNTIHCVGCFSMYCKGCREQQSQALKEIEELLTRLEIAESLYPSSHAMAVFHPVYKCETFVGRVKAMCLWYNITRHHRLKLVILGKILARLQGERFQWPVQTSITESSASSTQENDNLQNLSNNSDTKPQPKLNIPKVQFNIEESTTESQSPNESTSSNDSIGTGIFSSSQSLGPSVGEYNKFVNDLNIFNIEPLAYITYDNVYHSTKIYRKYIENVLKSRGLGKSMSFLHQLHNLLLYKAQISLEKPGAEEYDSDSDLFDDEDVLQLDPIIAREQMEELRRYGYWSPEARSLGLPSYIPTFVFLALIPLEVMHEFLRMRLETRPTKPNPLSLEQLMKELREGLTLALTHRERFSRHINTALVEKETELEKYSIILDQFDSAVKKVLEVYLDYVDQWVLIAAPETHQKIALEKEWIFTKLISPMIPGMHTLAAKKFCLIIRNLLHSIGDRLVNRAHELNRQIDETALHDDAMKWQLLTICRETQALFTSERERSVKILFFAKTFCRDVEQPDFHREHYEEYLNKCDYHIFICPAIKEAFNLLKKEVLDVRNKLIKIIEKVQERCSIKYINDMMDEQDKQAVLSRSREILHQGYKFGFEYNKDVIRLFEQKMMSCKDEDCDLDLSLGVIAFAKMWMQFVTERCERGRGVRPRWATQGLEFLILACDPQITRHLDEKQFEDLKKKMDCCISHVIGIISEPEKTRKKASPRTRKTSSPVTSRSRTPTRMTTPLSAGIQLNPTNQKFLQPQLSLREERQNSLSASNSSTDLTVENNEMSKSANVSPVAYLKSKENLAESPALRQIRVRDAVNRLDMELENKLREKNLIGQVKTLTSTDKVQIRARSVNFRWHRGIKIGQGRFGKVYTAVNNATGELMAMKEIPIQPGETRAIKKVAEELKILEGISHRNLVKYYGIEIHREELLIFMELCSEGTLESLVELSGSLHEGLTRRYTAQLLSGVAELHKHGIVHRDIKTANIFLVDSNNSLKLGDFGCAVKIQSHTTVPGELQGYVGTQAYMAPEVFTKTNSDGHGRAADIWSIGCVVVEMSSGKRPWFQFDSNFQIMFKVGMGEIPDIPDSLSQEGHEFLDKSFQHDPKLRWTASKLLEHNFCKVELGESKDQKPGTPKRNRAVRKKKQ